MKQDVEKYSPITLISNISLMINTYGTLVKTKEKMFDYNTSSSEVKSLIKSELEAEKSGLALIGVTFNNIEKKATSLSKKISFTYELIQKSFLNEVNSSFKVEGIKIGKLIASHKAARAAIKPYTGSFNFIYNVSIEEKFTTVNIFKDGMFINSAKSPIGLDYIYENIKSKMPISKSEARKLFRNIGNIPPEAVKDNKVIFNKVHEDGTQTAYSKKDLSRYITESVNDIFEGIAANLIAYKDENPTLLFSGEISILKGFEEYAKIALAMTNVQIFKTTLVGINLDTNFSTIGALTKIQKNITTTEENKIQLSREAYLTNPKKNITTLLLKASKYFNYI